MRHNILDGLSKEVDWYRVMLKATEARSEEAECGCLTLCALFLFQRSNFDYPSSSSSSMASSHSLNPKTLSRLNF
ncbi:hypothetical protein RJT34_04538 [Clitoria ternatea]|uniref:Uncharacterized protein n=1 Tax=Clitoria ternatea TaxID=43366 RepID=A0AAN9KNQ0_CLITE